MDRKQLEAYRLRTGFNLQQQERDYFQHLILSFIASKTTSLVFKGGTALQKAYQLPRFSEDLDFEQSAGQKGLPPLELFEQTARWLDAQGFATRLEHQTNPEGTGKSGRFLISGILFDGSNPSKCSVRYDVSLRDGLVRKAKAMPIKPPYADLLEYVLPVMAPDEMAAEKVRAIWSREQVRDIYDLHFLLQQGVEIDSALVAKKMEVCREKPTWAAIRKKIEAREKLWGQMDLLTRTKPAWPQMLKFLESRLPAGPI